MAIKQHTMKRLISLLFLFSTLLSFGQRATKRVHELELETTLNNSYSLLVDSPEFPGLKRLDLLGLKTFFYSSLVAFESDPIFISWNKSTGISISESQIVDLQNYITSESDPAFYGSAVSNVNSTDITNWNTAFAWGDHSTVGYLTSFTETDPIYSAWDKSTGISITESQISDLGNYQPAINTNGSYTFGSISINDPGQNEGITWSGGNIWRIFESPDVFANSSGNLQFVQNTTRRLTIGTDGKVTALGTLYEGSKRVLTSESDPIYSAWNKSTGISITESQISDLGNYLTSYTETDPNLSSWLATQDANNNQMIDEADQAVNAGNLSGHSASYYLDYNNLTNTPSQTDASYSGSVSAGNDDIRIGTNGIYFENDKHAITFNDGYGNFNIRIGNNGLSGETCTENGYIFQDEYSQSSGFRQFNISSTSLAVGNAPSWRTQIFYDYNKVKLYYQGSTKLETTSTGLAITGTATATAFTGDGTNLANVNAETVDGYTTNYSGTTAYTIPVRNSAGDIFARLFRSTYGEQTAAPVSTADIAFRNSTSDNYIRFMSQSAMKTWLGLTQALTATSNVTFGTVSGSNFYGTNFYLSSDRRLKENIKPLSEDIAYKLNPISHTWKNSDNLIVEVGFIADEVQKINSALVTTKPDGYDAVNYAKITAINNAAIHDLNARLKAIEEKLTKLLEDK